MTLAQSSILALPTAQTREDHADVEVRLEVHDASRLEWSVSVPLPEAGQAPYSIDVELEIPANVFARHLPWDQLQSWTRLDGGEAPRLGEAPSVDALRRGALAVAHKLARASEGFARHCRLAGAPWASAFTADSLRDGLELWMAVAVSTASEARTSLAMPRRAEAIELTRERPLADEYISVRLLEMLAAAERSIDTLRGGLSPHVVELATVLGALEEQIGTALSGEFVHRDAQRWHNPDPRVPSSLESYLERASRLKKHFQEVLFLEAETYQVAERLHNWVAAFVAIVASTWAFAWQIALTQHRPTTTSQVGSGVFLVAVIAGVIYAVKDRIKELGRVWISGNVHRFYAQRVARWRAPARRSASRDVVVRARESFDTSIVRRADPLSPESGATMPSTLLHYVHRGVVNASAELSASGVQRVKHVFRYDFSPIFARLDDPVKQVPVLDGVTRRVRFSDAPRCYRVPVRLQVRAPGCLREQRATLVLHKRGLDRLEFEAEREPELVSAALSG